MQDDKVRECYDCKLPFTAFRRKHHCRICGQIFCYKCASSIIPGDRFGYSGYMRVCNLCLKIMYDRPSFETEHLGVQYTQQPTINVESNGSPQSPSIISGSFSSQSIGSGSLGNNSLSNHWNSTQQTLSQPRYSASTKHKDIQLSPFKRIISNSLFQRPQQSFQPDGYDNEGIYTSNLDIPGNDNVSINVEDSDSSNNSSYKSVSLNDLWDGSQLNDADFMSGRSPNRKNPLRSVLTIENHLKRERRRHSRSTSIVPQSEIPKFFYNYMKHFLRQLFVNADIKNATEWESVIMKILLKVCSNLLLDVRGGDSMDLRDYVKIKHIPGGDPTHSEYITGIVFTKSLSRRSMNHKINNPKILILTFALEYQRVENQFLSLDPLVDQERDYLRNLVNRVISLKPDLVVVQKSVSYVALQFLIDANITVIYNIKPNIVEEIARCTGADIINSIDKLVLDPKLGVCEVFQPRSYTSPLIAGTRKTYLYFVGCNPESACTIVLRGGSSEELRKIKRIVNLTTMVIYNLKLETSVLKDLNTTILEDQHVIRVLPKLDLVKWPLDMEELYNLLEMYTFYFTKSCISASPNVNFKSPLVLERLLTYIKNNAHKVPLTENDSILIDSTISDRVSMPIKDASKKFIEEISRLSPPESRPAIENIISNAEFITPYTQQNIFVLYSSNCPNVTSIAWQHPVKHFIKYYAESDLTLGQYVEEICLQASLNCPEKICDSKLLNHIRTYIHESGKIIITVEEFETNDSDNSINTWSICKSCGSPSPITTLSELTWKYSFGKFLELYFYADAYKRSCGHSLFKESILYFKYGVWVVKFDYEGIVLHDIIVPYIYASTKSKHGILSKLRQKDAEVIQLRITEYYDSIENRISQYSYDSIDKNKLEDVRATMDNYNKKALAEKKYLLQLVQQSIVSSRETDTLALNNVIKELQLKITEWDAEFTNFIQTYAVFESKNDIRKLTAVQLRKMFVDKEKTNDMVVGVSLASSMGLISGTPSNANAISKSHIDTHIDNSMPIFGTSPTDDKTLFKEFPKITVSDNSDTDIDSKAKPQSVSFNREINDGTTSNDIKKPSNEDFEYAVKRRMSFKYMDKNRVNLDLDHARQHTEARINSLAKSKSIDIGSAYNIDYDEELDNGTILPQVQETAKLEERPVFNSKKEDKPTVLDTDSLEPRISVGSENSENIIDSPKSLKNDKEDSTINANPIIALEKVREVPKPQFRNLMNNKYSFSTGIGSLEDESCAEWNAITGVTCEQNSTLDHKPLSKDMNIMGTERSSIMKTITNLWSNPSAILQPLKYPLKPTEHLFNDSLVIVREEEPTSLIAYALNSKQNSKLNDSSKIRKTSTVVDSSNIDEIWSTKADMPELNIEEVQEKELDFKQPQANLKHDNGEVVGNMIDPEEEDAGPKGSHLGLRFKDGSTKLSCNIFFAEEFESLRKNCGIEETYIQSLARCAKWDTSGGKSGSTFLKTRDDRFIVKQLSKVEMDSLFKFAPAYFDYMSKALFQKLPTVLTKIFGFYRISYKNSVTGKSVRLDCFVMENLFYDRKFKHIFDLKGSTRNRHVQSTGKQNEVLLDDNLIEYIQSSPLYIREPSKRLLRAALWNDTLFLSKLNVMDYSLLLGIDLERKELVIGILDFVRTFTWDKKLESWVKETAFLGGGRNEPTIISPGQYKGRFREAMERYFLMVPDKFFLSPTVVDREASL